MKTTHQTSHHADTPASAAKAPTRQAPRKKAAAQAAKRLHTKGCPEQQRLCTGLDELPPIPAFQPFAINDEEQRRSWRQSRGISIRYTNLAPNSALEMDLLYLEATEQSSDEIQTTSRNGTGRIVHKEKHVPAKPEEAARQLLELAMNATAFLSMLMKMNPGLCRQMAAMQSGWPVMVDLRDADWQAPIAQTISKLELGKSIDGFLRSGQTSHRNIIRRWATAIHETLRRTRFDFKEAQSGKNRHKTTEGCPEWARKTLALPTFTKASARDWARLGEEMLLQQMPSFLDQPEFVQKKRSWTHRARQKSDAPSPRAVRREAFEDLAKELKNIAPERELWLGEW